jgi:cytochrome P450
MGALVFTSAIMFLLAGIFTVLALLGVPILLLIVVIAKSLLFYVQESMSKDQRPPVAGPMLNQLVNFNRLFDYQTSLARKYSTYRLITHSHSEIYTADPTNVEYILKTNFANYGRVINVESLLALSFVFCLIQKFLMVQLWCNVVQGVYNSEIMRELFGDGIFAVDGDKWRHQRKLASYEFSTKVLRDFSTAIFQATAAKLVSKISTETAAKQMINLQVW